MTSRWPAGLLLTATLLGCGKVPLSDVDAGFVESNAAWFEEEQTLFAFYEVQAAQGLGDNSVIEITYTTDEARVDWVPLADLPMVHTHVPVDCGPNARCGSASLSVPIEPRDVRLRLRYHRDGVLALNADTVYNVVAAGPPHESRSLIVYGVFGQFNQRIQWRARHQFPAVRNERATALGLRRDFEVQDPTYGTPDDPIGGGAYGYGWPCPASFDDAGLSRVATDARAIFTPDELPLAASTASLVCATSTVFDALGPFTTSAVARKNPEVRSAFPALTSPVRDANVLPFFLAPCQRTISEPHAEMQRQRLLFGDDVPTTCIDDWQSPGFADRLTVLFADAVEAARPEGRDMVLVIGLHQDQAAMADAVEEALANVAPEERQRTTPRLAGAFVFDSTDRGLEAPGLAPVTLWCPSTIPLDAIPDASARSCPILPDIPDIRLGPLSFNVLPILPTRRQYLDFIDEYSVGTAGETTDLYFRVPEFAASTEHLDLGDFGVVTFLNGEAIDADPDDAFSYCAQDELDPFVVRSALLDDPEIRDAILQACDEGLVPEALCTAAEFGVLPLQNLPEWHNAFGESRYAVGLFWEFPFLLRMEYEAAVAGSVSAFGLSVPFGVRNPAQALYGAQIWQAQTLSLDPTLTQCRRFCDHPTFDNAGIYHPFDAFRETYAQACYQPRYPMPGDTGFPRDP